MTEHTHSEFFSTPPIESLPDDIRARLEDIQGRSGFLPNIFVAMARRPDEFRAFLIEIEPPINSAAHSTPFRAPTTKSESIGCLTLCHSRD